MLKLNKSQIHIIKEQLYKAYKQTADKGHRNLNWFDTLINVPFNYNKYTDWYVIPDVAFATVQKYNNSQRLFLRFQLKKLVVFKSHLSNLSLEIYIQK